MKKLILALALLAATAPAHAGIFWDLYTTSSSTTLRMVGAIKMYTANAYNGSPTMTIDSVAGTLATSMTATFTATGNTTYDVTASSGIKSNAGTIYGNFIQAVNGFYGNLTGSVTGNATTATTATNLAGGLANEVAYQSGAGATTFTAQPGVNVVLTANSGAPTWTNTPTFLGTNISGTAASLTAGLATALAGGGVGQVPIQTASGVTAFIPNGAAGGIDIFEGVGVLKSTGPLNGTANQVIVTNNTGPAGITLSLPQSIHTGATVTFLNGNFTGTLAAGTTSIDGTAFVLVSTGMWNLFSPMSTTEIAALKGRQDGAIVYNTTKHQFQYYSASDAALVALSTAAQSGGQTLSVSTFTAGIRDQTFTTTNFGGCGVVGSTVTKTTGAGTLTALVNGNAYSSSSIGASVLGVYLLVDGQCALGADATGLCFAMPAQTSVGATDNESFTIAYSTTVLAGSHSICVGISPAQASTWHWMGPDTAIAGIPHLSNQVGFTVVP